MGWVTQATEITLTSPASSTTPARTAGSMSRVRETQGLRVRSTSMAAGAPQAMRWARTASGMPREAATSSSWLRGSRRASRAAVPPASSRAEAITNSRTCSRSPAVHSSLAFCTRVVR